MDAEPSGRAMADRLSTLMVFCSGMTFERFLNTNNHMWMLCSIGFATAFWVINGQARTEA